jgi:hypothetical protein
VRPYRLSRPRRRRIWSAKPASSDARARRSSHSIAAPPQRRAAACGREQATHRRVDEVAHAGHQHPRYERLGHQHEHAGVKGKLLSRFANLVRSDRKETVETSISSTSQNTPKCQNSSKAVTYRPSDLQRCSANKKQLHNGVNVYRNDNLN